MTDFQVPSLWLRASRVSACAVFGRSRSRAAWLRKIGGPLLTLLLFGSARCWQNPVSADPARSLQGRRVVMSAASGVLPDSPGRREVLQGTASALGLAALALGPNPAEALTAEEKRVMTLFQVTTPSVVSISKKPPQVKGLLGVPGEERAGAVYGSGFVWDETHIVTNYHVVRGNLNKKIYVTFLSRDQGATKDRRTTLDATVVGSDSSSDVAVLRVGNQTFNGLPAPPGLMKALPRLTTAGESLGLGVGQDVFAFGNPFGLEHSLSRGIISGVSRTLESSTGRPIQGIIQTDASINPGNSGGPLLDSDGRVIGVNTAIVTGTGTFAGVGLAIPIDTVTKNVASILSKGFVGRPFLGIVFAPDVMAQQLQTGGVMVMQVVPAGPAEIAGIKPMRAGRFGDIVMAIDGGRVATVDDLFKLLDTKQPGDEVRLSIQRVSKDSTIDAYEDVEINLKLGTTATAVNVTADDDSAQPPQESE